MPSLDALQWSLAACALAALVVGYWKKVRPALQRFMGGVDVLVGRDPFVDQATGKTVERIPPLGTALREMRGDIASLASTVAQVADQQIQLKNLDTRVTALESDKVERIVTKAESAAMWQAVANRDVIDEEPL